MMALCLSNGIHHHTVCSERKSTRESLHGPRLYQPIRLTLPLVCITLTWRPLCTLWRSPVRKQFIQGQISIVFPQPYWNTSLTCQMWLIWTVFNLLNWISRISKWKISKWHLKCIIAKQMINIESRYFYDVWWLHINLAKQAGSASISQE